MRVALLSYNAQAGDAIGNQVAEKLAFFLERGANVRVFVESGERLHPEVRPFCRIIRDPEPAGEEWRFLSSADLVVVEYGQHYALLSFLPLLAGRKPRILFDYHGVTPPDLWGTHNREALEKGARQRGLVWCADAAVAHSRFTQRELLEHTLFPADRSHVVGHPVDVKRFCPGAPDHHLRDELGLDGANLLLFVGRLACNKRVPLLIEALHRLRDRTSPVHAVIVGDTGDLYEAKARRCRKLATELRLADRVHFLGHVTEDRLLDAYRSADVFVMPSRHEGFCIPVLEAMACGLPVVAARAGALPATVADAGLTFTPDDADDLARQLRRVLDTDKVASWQGDKAPKQLGSLASCALVPLSPCPRLRVAVVSFRYGTGFAGGAETSLRTIASTLDAAGHHVEVFTTCTQSEGKWANELPEGTTQVGGISVHRFRLDPHDRERHFEIVRAILHSDGPLPDEVERQYLAHSLHSTRLLEALRRRLDEFDAVLVGPYLFGLTYDVARAFSVKTVLVPCFHDEPLARLQIWRAAYEGVGGILYHSPEEETWAETEYGLNHPGSSYLGAILDVETRGDAARGRALAGTDQPYLLYCGRYSVQKNLPTVLEYARHYEEIHPGRFTFVFVGQGEVAVPDEPWARELGFVDEASKRDLLAGAAALVQLSQYESLSLVALEAWAQGTPVLAEKTSAVLVEHLHRSGGGRAVQGFESFAQALDELWEGPEQWAAQGACGREYVRRRYGSRTKFLGYLEEAIRDLTVPLAERMRRRGLSRAAEHDRSKWRDQFSSLVEQLLDAPRRLRLERVEVRPYNSSRTVSSGQGSVLVPVRLANQGTHAVVDEGPARSVVRCVVVDEAGRPCGTEIDTPLPGILVPGQEVGAAVRVPVPMTAGVYRACLSVQSVWVAGQSRKEGSEWQASVPVPPALLGLTVEDRAHAHAENCCGPLLDEVQVALAEAERRQRLPDDYTDVTEGLLAKWKRWIKRKLVGNFKHAYVDVLSRQQSSFNRHVLAALQELAECSTMLDHACSTQAREPAGLESLIERLAETRRRCAALEERLSRLEARPRENEEARS